MVNLVTRAGQGWGGKERWEKRGFGWAGHGLCRRTLVGQVPNILVVGHAAYILVRKRHVLSGERGEKGKWNRKQTNSRNCSVRCLISELCDGQSTQARLLTASTVLPSITRSTVGNMSMLIEFHTVFLFFVI